MSAIYFILIIGFVAAVATWLILRRIRNDPHRYSGDKYNLRDGGRGRYPGEDA